MSKSKILYEQLHPNELKDIIKYSGIIYLPLGTLEWHDNHLPLGLDALVSYYISIKSCEKTGGCVITPLCFGTDREHNINGKILHGMDAYAKKMLPGSIYFLKEDLFYSLLKSIAYNVSEQGFKTLVIISAHSGTAQQRTLEKIEKERIKDLKIITFPGKKFPGGIDHAARIETSMMLAIRKELVELENLTKPHEVITGENPKLATTSEGQTRLRKIINQITTEVNQRKN